MKVSARSAVRMVEERQASLPAVLLYGVDPLRVSALRAKIVAAWLGSGEGADLRLERLDGAELRRDPEALVLAMKAQGFFAGPRVVLVEGAGDAALDAVEAALSAFVPGDALIVLTAGDLRPQSKLRRLFEGHKHAAAVAVYDDPPTPEEIDRALAKVGFKALSSEARRDLHALAQALAPSEFELLLERLALFKQGDPTPLSPAEVEALAPTGIEAEVDDLITAATAGELRRIPLLVARLLGQGVSPVTMALALLRHLRLLHWLASEPAGAAAALERLRPPLPFRLRNRVLRELQRWEIRQLDAALTEAFQLDLSLRQSPVAPARALVERGFLKVAALARQRG